MMPTTTTTTTTNNNNTPLKDVHVKHHPEHESTNSALINDYMTRDILNLLLAYRFINALCVQTFFQPDEYFQALEPAWQLAFGSDSGAWITWEWHHQLRSSLHPALFAVTYYVANTAMTFVEIFPQMRAMLLAVLPNVVQGLFAATGDYYTWQLARKLYGRESDTAWAALLMTIFSPWQWFCSTRTFSNSIETTLTIMALHYWPWEMLHGSDVPRDSSQTKDGVFKNVASVKHLRVSLLCAALACILRPTNLLVWVSVVPLTVFRPFSQGTSRIQLADYLVLVREAVICGAAVLAASALSDLYYFGEWTFPPYHWLHFNVAQDLAIFYGSMPFHYYLSQGIPLLLTTYLPIQFLAPFIKTDIPPKAQSILFVLITTVISMLVALSLIAHKEVRFIYPILPILHIVLAPTATTIFTTTETITKFPPPFPSTPIVTTKVVSRRSYLKYSLLIANIGLSYYVTQVHQTGVLSVMKFLRNDYETLALDTHGNLNSLNITYPGSTPLESWEVSDYSDDETFAAFLMPCHSTPWRSQLVHPGLKAWALTCEPPIHLVAGSPERAAYRDEADRFYDDPERFLTDEVGGRERPWPRYVVGFEGIESVLRTWYEKAVPGFRVRERWRGRNSQWHDDSRRMGDVVVWEFIDGSELQRMW